MASEQTALGQAVLRPGGGLGSSWGYRGKAMAVEKGEERTAASEKAAGRSRDGISYSEGRGVQEVMA